MKRTGSRRVPRPPSVAPYRFAAAAGFWCAALALNAAGQGIVIEPPRGDGSAARPGAAPGRGSDVDARKWAVKGMAARNKANPDSKRTLASDKQALLVLRDVVGTWRGQGQPKRGSNRGAWVEQSEWEWRFVDEGAGLVLISPQSRIFAAAWLAPTDKPGTFRFVGLLPDGKTEETYEGVVNERGVLVATRGKAAAKRPARITLTLVAGGARLVMRYDRFRGRSTSHFTQLAMVGYTRKGSGFGQGAKITDCVVTGGKGSRTVRYQGKTFYVCCGGCRDEFLENPAKVLAEWKVRLAKEKKKAARD